MSAGRTDPVDTTVALAKGARMQGAKIFEQVPVIDVLIDRRPGAGAAVKGVRTAYGDIECEFIVNCCGMWARQLAAKSGVNVPLQSAEHYYLITDKIPGVDTLWDLIHTLVRIPAGAFLGGIALPTGTLANAPIIGILETTWN